MGDSLRRKIDEGLVLCRYGIVIISPSFLTKEWPQRELDGLVAREAVSGKKAILPIWHQIDRSTVVSYSPTLADRLAGRSDEGVDVLVRTILDAIR
jgi:TIR domain